MSEQQDFDSDGNEVRKKRFGTSASNMLGAQAIRSATINRVTSVERSKLKRQNKEALAFNRQLFAEMLEATKPKIQNEKYERKVREVRLREEREHERLKK